MYDEIMKNIIDVFYYHINIVEKQFNDEYFNDSLMDYGCFIHGNNIDVINQKLTHYRFYITKNYLKNLRNESMESELTILYKEETLSEYIKEGSIKITYEYETVGIMCSTISENDKFMIYYYLKDKPIKKIILENINSCNVFEYKDLKDFMENI